ncbi:MAG: polysaccharide biosynthesis tyrosine autokinase [Polyangia bacterium]
MESGSENEIIEQPSALPGAEAPKLDVRAYWRIVRKRWPMVALTTLAAMGVAFLYTYRQPKIYEATCQIVIEPMSPQVLQGVKDVVELGTGTYWATKEFYETQYRIIQSTAVAMRVAEKLGLGNDPDFREAAQSKDPTAVARMIQSRVRVQPVKDSRIGSIIVEDVKPQRAALIANTVGETYMEYNLDYKLEGAKTANAWLSEQAIEYKKKLRDSELGLYEFRRQRNLLAARLDDRQSMTAQNLENVSAALSKVRLKRIEIEAARKLILSAKDDINRAESIPEVQASEVVTGLRRAFVQLSKDRAELLAKYGPEHPKMKMVEGQIQSIQEAYHKEIANVLATFENEYLAVVDQEKALMRAMEDEKKEAIELSKVEVEYKPLSRDNEENLKLYNLISTREREIDLTGLLRTNNVRLLERAIVPGAPVRPRPVQNLMIAFLVGLGGGIGIALLIEALDNTLKSPSDVEAYLGIPVLGLIPVIGNKDEKASPDKIRERDLGIFMDPKSLAAECCRSIRTNILFMSPDHPPHTIVVTSPSPQEGKTTTTINLAVTMAEAGARVLIIDTDMRRPRLHRSFGVPNQAGISTVVVGNSTLDEVIKRTEVPNLDVLPCGPLPPNPSELLHAERFAQIIRDCAKRYDRVLLDSPPTSAVTDPAVLGNLCDGVLLVVKGGQTKRESAALARRQLLAAKAKILGVIVNEIDFSNPSYGYQYYYYRDYARYGYGGSPEEREASS